MIYEMRTYTLKPGTGPEFLRFYEAEVAPVITSHLRLAGFWATEVGALNTVVGLWAYEDLADRTARRAELAADPRWGPVVKQMLPYLVGQESALLTPAAFSPMK